MNYYNINRVCGGVFMWVLETQHQESLGLYFGAPYFEKVRFQKLLFENVGWVMCLCAFFLHIL